MSPRTSKKARASAEAAEWFVRLKEPVVSTTDLAAFQVWRRVPANARAYRHVEGFWRASATLGSDPVIQKELRNILKKRRQPPWGQPQPNLPLAWGIVGLAMTMLVAGVLIIELDALRFGRIYQAAVGQQRLITLSDGSNVRLDTDTRLAVRLSGRVRRITLLRGQAYFEVAHDHDRPFLVDAGRTEVLAVGTIFDVRRAADGVRVTLVEGVVKVRDLRASDTGSTFSSGWTLAAGQALTVAVGAAPHPANLESAISWTKGRLIFDNEPLRSAVAEVNRYSDKRVILDAPALSEIPVSGAFQAGDVDAFVSAASRLYGLQVLRQADGTILLRPGGKAP